MTPNYRVARDDILEGVGNWRVWVRLGWQDVKRRYRRSVLGPLWFTLSLALFVSAMGFIWAPLFHASVQAYLPFVSAGMVSWTYVSVVIGEGCLTYTSAEGIIKQLNLPFTILNCIVVWRNVIVLLHNLIVVVVVGLILHIPLTWSTLLFIPGLVIVAVNGLWISMLLGMLSARFRDIPPLVTNVVQILLFVTPVFWSARQLPLGSQAIVDYNYVFHLVDILRAPLLGAAPSSVSYVVTIAGTVIGWAVAFAIYARFRRRIPYWL